MMQLVQPKYLIPVHGELRHLKQHALLAQEMGIPREHIAVVENGQVIEFEDGEMSLGERIPGDYVFVDGAGVGDIGPSVVREREALARDGFVLVNLIMDENTGHLRSEPEIITRGFVYFREAEELIEETKNRIRQAVGSSNGNPQNDVKQSVRTFLYNETKRRPMVFVTLTTA